MRKFDEMSPIYLQIVDTIKGRIISGELNGGDKLPSVRDFSVEIKVNPNTISRSYQELERQGVTETKRGLGTFVLEDPELVERLRIAASKTIIGNFLQRMKASGFTFDEIPSLVERVIKDFS